MSTQSTWRPVTENFNFLLSWASAELLPPHFARFYQVFADFQNNFEITERASSGLRKKKKKYTVPRRSIANVEILSVISFQSHDTIGFEKHFCGKCSVVKDAILTH